MLAFRSPLVVAIPALAALALVAIHPQRAFAWGDEGHRMVNRLAAANLPKDVPEFLRSEAAAHEIEYLGPEPDRWRSQAEPELVSAQAPEHYIDLELADALGGPLPHKRFDFYAKAYAAGQNPAKIGLQPWQAVEVWERLKVAMRTYRLLSAQHKETREVEASVIFYAGWLGHYVGDACQPLHTTVQYNGWTGPNPNGYTTSQKIHWQFEGIFVHDNEESIDADARPKVTAEAHLIDGDIFDQYMAYLRHTSTYVEKVYQLEKAGGFTGKGSEESRQFTAERIAAGASMLRDMIYTAWVDSGKPIPAPNYGM